MMLYRRLRGDAILTRDFILRSHRFTNTYRAADRVTQYLIRHVIPAHDGTATDVIFRVLLFKIFNKIETWVALQDVLGHPIHWHNFSVERYVTALGKIAAKAPIYSNAYMMPNPPFGHRYKYANHLDLIHRMIAAGLTDRLCNAQSLRALYETLAAVPSFGRFLAFQFAIDLNYTDLFAFSEMDFVVAGPGAQTGIKKCFSDVDGYEDADVIRIMTELSEKQFAELNLPFYSLWGRPLQLIDCQNIFCEIDKYTRVAYPELGTGARRSRIKQKFFAARAPLPEYQFPPKWGVTVTSSYGLDVPRISY